jgi:nucleotide-binding universal stress UspA family protein
MHDYRRILALVDFSDAGIKVAQRALKLARLGRAELTFLHLISPTPTLDGGYPSPSRKACEQNFEQAAVRRLAFLSSNLGEAGMGEVVLLARYGQPARSFAEIVSGWRPDLVVAEADPGFLDGRHDLLILGRQKDERGLMKRVLHLLLTPGSMLHGV